MNLRELLEQRLTVPTHSHDASEIDFSDLRPTTLRIPNRDSDPSGVEGLVYYNTVTKQLMAYVDGAWSHVVDASILDAKGDLLVATGADAIARLPVGADGTFLTADASQPGWMKWDTPPPGGPQGKMLWTPTPHPYRAGAWYAARDFYGASSAAMTAGRILFVGPFHVGQAISVDRIGFFASTAADNVRLALYSADSLGQPGTLVVESASTVIVSNANAVTVTSTALTANTLYYLAVQFSSGAMSVRCYPASSGSQGLVPHAGAASAALDTDMVVFAHSQAFGAFPSSPTLTTVTASAVPILSVRTV